MRRSLRYQLLVPPVLLLLAVAGITAWIAVSSAQRARRQLETRVRHVVETLRGPLKFDLSTPVLKAMSLLSGAELLQIGEDGKVNGTIDEVPPGLPPPSASDEIALEGRVLVNGEPYLCSGVRLDPPRESNTLYILYPEALWRDALEEAVRPSLLIGGGVGLAAVALAVAVGQRLTRRIRELDRRTRRIAAGDFSPMPLPVRDDEIRDLAASVNDMAGKLAQLREAVQRAERLRLLGQVSGGLAHQLRNGVQGARLAVQVHQRELASGETSDPSALDVALRQLTLVETNLKRFLDLGKRHPSALAECSLPALVGEAVALVRPQCRHARIDLHWQPPAEDIVVEGDAGQLQELFLNVLSNAVEAAGPGGEVAMTLWQEAGRVVIEVCDTGPGPAPEVAARLFEPFVTGKSEGIGLGLAVARQVAEGHGGHISWERHDGRTCFRIELGGVVR